MGGEPPKTAEPSLDNYTKKCDYILKGTVRSRHNAAARPP